MIQGGSLDSRNAAPGARVGFADRSTEIMPEFRSAHFSKKGALAAPRQNDDINPKRKSDMLEMTELSGKAALLKMISSFLENMGRKVRTPLNAVMGFSDVMSDEESEETRMEYKKIVDENSALMLRMADDMISFTTGIFFSFRFSIILELTKRATASE